MTKKERLLLKYRKEHEILPKYVPCTLEEHAEYSKLYEEDNLPAEVRACHHDGLVTFEKIDGFDFTQEEINEVLLHKQLDTLTSINGSLNFIVGVIVFGIIVGIISLIVSCSMFG